MKTLIVVNGENDWQGYLPGIEVQPAMAHFKADVLGLDFLQTRDENYHLLESNDTPGLSGFPDEVRKAVARQVRKKWER